jgi:hypothetical protein
VHHFGSPPPYHCQALEIGDIKTCHRNLAKFFVVRAEVRRSRSLATGLGRQGANPAADFSRRHIPTREARGRAFLNPAIKGSREAARRPFLQTPHTGQATATTGFDDGQVARDVAERQQRFSAPFAAGLAAATVLEPKVSTYEPPSPPLIPVVVHGGAGIESGIAPANVEIGGAALLALSR